MANFFREKQFEWYGNGNKWFIDEGEAVAKRIAKKIDLKDADAAKQGGLEWHEHRDQFANASEAPAVMDSGRFQPHNKRELTMVRNGTLVIEHNDRMQQGHDMEAFVRSKFVGWNWQPRVVAATIDGIPMSASLDAVGDAGQGRGHEWCEIKVATTQSSHYLVAAKIGQIPETAYWQMMHQWIVAREHGITTGWFVVYDAENDKSYSVKFEPEMVDGDEDRLVQAWQEVWPYIQKGEVYGERKDDAWTAAAVRFKAAKQLLDRAEKDLEDARQALITLADGKPSVGCGITVTEVTRSGGVDYSKLDPAEKLPRKQDKSYWTVGLTKPKKGEAK